MEKGKALPRVGKPPDRVPEAGLKAEVRAVDQHGMGTRWGSAALMLPTFLKSHSHDLSTCAKATSPLLAPNGGKTCRLQDNRAEVDHAPGWPGNVIGPYKRPAPVTERTHRSFSIRMSESR